MDYTGYPRPVVQDISRLRRRIAASGLPPKTTDRSDQHMAVTLGLDPAMPDPLDTIPDL